MLVEHINPGLSLVLDCDVLQPLVVDPLVCYTRHVFLTSIEVVGVGTLFELVGQRPYHRPISI